MKQTLTRLSIVFSLASFPFAGCSTPITETAEPCRQKLVSTAGADLTLHASGSCHGTLRLTARVAVAGEDGAVRWLAPGREVALEGAWSQVAGGEVVRPVKVKNLSGKPLRILGVEWSTGDDGLTLEADRMLNNGYQSWSYTGVMEIPSSVEEANGTAAFGGDDEDVTAERQGVSWWWTAISDGKSPGLAAGFTSAKIFKSFLAVDRPASAPRLRMVSGMTGDEIELAPGAARDLDGLWLSFGDLTGTLERYAAAVGAQNPPRTPRQAPLGGWGSWNVYYDHPTADLLRQDAAWAEEKLVPVEMTDFLLDDGYENRWGEWSASVTFGAELPALNAEVEARGLRPAIWLAPFYINVESQLVKDHPAWFVRNEDGSLRTYDNIGTIHAALDVSNAEARAFVTQTVQNYWSWGYRTLKIDFLFGAGVQGLRAEKMTSMESYARWMTLLREAVPEAHLVGCGAPLLPSVGLVDSMRTGSDIAFTVEPEPRYAYYAVQARNNGLRYFTAGWWAMDPDVILLRGTQIDENEAWMAIVAAALTGGNYLLGDGRQASEERQALALAPEVLELARDGVAARPLDFDDEVDPLLRAFPLADPAGSTRLPHRWKKASGGKTWLAVFGWSETKYAAKIEFPQGAVELVPTGSVEQPLKRTAISGEQTVRAPLHGVRLFRW